MPPRVSSRNQSSKRARKGDDEFIDDGSSDETNRKTRKTKAKGERTTAPWQRPRGRGKLKMLPEMPVDILLEIFSLLNPLDIIRLARTTKALRGILMSHSAITVWKAALAHEPELPNMPTDMNEPQWANLAFSNHCHFCLSAGDYPVLWAFRVRCCEKCMKDHFASKAEVLRRLTGKMICKHPDLLLRAHATGKRTKAEASHTREVCGYIDAKGVNLQLARLKKDKDQFDAYVAERGEIVARVEKFVAQCEQATFIRADRLRREAEAERGARNERIFQRLKDLGYGNEVERLNEVDPTILSEHPSIKQTTKELTERAWATMLPALVELMEDTRGKIQRKQRKYLLKKRLRLVSVVYEDYKRSRSRTEVTPSPADICSMPQVMAMLEHPAPDAYTSSEGFVELQEQFSQLSDEWVASKNLELISLMPRIPANLVPGSDEGWRLELATTFFQCSECIEPISYPRVLVHRCLTAIRLGNRNREDDRTLLYTSLDCEPWNTGCGRVSYFNAAEVSARSVLQGYGLNADVVTATDLKDMDKWLECLRCTHRTKGRPVFKWQKAILHDMNHVVSDNQSATWAILSNDDAKLAQEQEDHEYLTYFSDSSDFVCARCDERMPFSALRSHARFSHGAQELRKEDYRLDLDAAIQPPFSVMIPNLLEEPVIIDLSTPPPRGIDSQYIVPEDDDDLYV